MTTIDDQPTTTYYGYIPEDAHEDGDGVTTWDGYPMAVGIKAKEPIIANRHRIHPRRGRPAEKPIQAMSPGGYHEWRYDLVASFSMASPDKSHFSVLVEATSEPTDQQVAAAVLRAGAGWTAEDLVHQALGTRFTPTATVRVPDPAHDARFSHLDEDGEIVWKEEA